MKTHYSDDEKKHVCNVCGHRFAKIKFLKNHMTVHSDVRKYACEVRQISQHHVIKVIFSSFILLVEIKYSWFKILKTRQYFELESLKYQERKMDIKFLFFSGWYYRHISYSFRFVELALRLVTPWSSIGRSSTTYWRLFLRMPRSARKWSEPPGRVRASSGILTSTESLSGSTWRLASRDIWWPWLASTMWPPWISGLLGSQMCRALCHRKCDHILEF